MITMWWLRIVCMWAGGFLLGLALRTVLPQSLGLFVMGKRQGVVLPLIKPACILGVPRYRPRGWGNCDG